MPLLTEKQLHEQRAFWTAAHAGKRFRVTVSRLRSYSMNVAP